MGEKIVVGKIAGVFGVRGWCKIFSDTSPRKNIFTYSPWYLERNGQLQEVKVLQGREQGKGLGAQLEGIDDRDEAATLVGMTISIDKDQLPELPQGEYYWSELIGLQVNTVTGTPLGKVTDMMATGANDVLVINGDRERLVPFVQPDVVVEVNLDAGQMTVDWDPDF